MYRKIIRIIYFVCFIPTLAQASCICPNSFCSREGEKPAIVYGITEKSPSLMICGDLEFNKKYQTQQSSCFVVAKCDDKKILDWYGEFNSYLINKEKDRLKITEIHRFFIKNQNDWEDVKFVEYAYKISKNVIKKSEKYVFRPPQMDESIAKAVLKEVKRTKNPNKNGDPILPWKLLAVALAGYAEAEKELYSLDEYWQWDAGPAEMYSSAINLYERHKKYTEKPNNQINKDAQLNAKH